MRVRIGVSDTDRVVEIEVEDTKTLAEEIEGAYASDRPLLWFDDVKGRRIGIPLARIAYVEMDSAGDRLSVGFAPSDP